MNLTTLRRLVLAGNIAALVAAGAAAWHAFESRPAPREEKMWQTIFPVKAAPTVDTARDLPPVTEFNAMIAGWPQGEKPKPVVESKEQEAPKVDPFKSKYRLNVVWLADPKDESYVQLAIVVSGQQGPGFSVKVGERIPEDPADWKNEKRTPWRLDAVASAGLDAAGKPSPSTALFRNVDTEEEIVLELVTGLPSGGFGTGTTAAAGGDARLGRFAKADGKPDEKQPPRIIQIRADKAKGEYEYELPDEELDWIAEYHEREIAGISSVPYRDASGNPAGFTLKAVPSGSRLAEMGFKPEDRVVSVNGEKVDSTEQAASVGKRQLDEGKSTFAIRFIRAGQERNYTFHAKKKKSGK